MTAGAAGAPPPPSADALARRLRVIPVPGPEQPLADARLDGCLAADGDGALARLLADAPDARDFLRGVASTSPYLRETAFADAARLVRVLADSPDARLEALVAAMARDDGSEADLTARLRRTKAEAALLIAFADIAGIWTLADVTAALTRLADAALGAALRHLLRDADRAGKLVLTDRDDPAAGCGWFVLAMGKAGAFELNYSSDVDLVVLFDADVVPAPDRSDLTTLFVRLTRRLARLLDERTADGYVFRVDLRLRPDPRSTPVALATEAALVYYESTGQNWERAAMIKARPAAGDIAAGERFLARLKPFIWRKYLDYAAIADIQSIKRQINAHKGFGDIAVAGHNVKLGRGGIREIEFFVQTQQLIAGGREPELRGRGTVAMLAALAAHGWIEAGERDALTADYDFLRRTEHAIQMLADEQTHTIPPTDEGIARIAGLLGYRDPGRFAADVRATLDRVSRIYSDLFADAGDLSSGTGNMVFTGDDVDPGTVATLSGLGFQRPEEAIQIVRSWHFGRYAATRSARARELLTELAPELIAALARTDVADQALATFDALIARLPAGVQLFSLLRANPQLVRLFATLMGNAPRLAEILVRRPHAMDALIDPRFFGILPGREVLARRLETSLGEARGYEDVLDRARIFAQEQMVLISVRVLSGTITARETGLAFARLAELVVGRVLAAATAEIERRHGRIAGGSVALLAMGKLGGEEMTASSDLDLIVIYDHPDGDVVSDGARPLPPGPYYARLTQALVTALTAPTAEGTLYDVDFRLRPSGNAGPLATSIAAFERYQREDAWTWEHMALVRARVIAATGDLGPRVDAVVAGILALPRDAAMTRADVADMRARLERERGSADLWNLKLVPGGMFDLDFYAQTLRLLNDGVCPALRRRSTEAILSAGVAAGLVPARHGEVLLAAARLYGDLNQLLRVTLGPDPKLTRAPEGVRDLLAAAAAAPSISELEARLVDMEEQVRAALVDLVGPIVRRGVE